MVLSSVSKLIVFLVVKQRWTQATRKPQAVRRHPAPDQRRLHLRPPSNGSFTMPSILNESVRLCVGDPKIAVDCLCDGIYRTFWNIHVSPTPHRSRRYCDIARLGTIAYSGHRQKDPIEKRIVKQAEEYARGAQRVTSRQVLERFNDDLNLVFHRGSSLVVDIQIQTKLLLLQPPRTPDVNVFWATMLWPSGLAVSRTVWNNTRAGCQRNE
jgi:hypothetical protein